jgi:hypothetical protein
VLFFMLADGAAVGGAQLNCGDSCLSKQAQEQPLHGVAGDADDDGRTTGRKQLMVELHLREYICKRSAVTECRVVRVTPGPPTIAAGVPPPWLVPQADVVVKRFVGAAELTCWQLLADCRGVPRVFVLPDERGSVTFTPDGVGSTTLEDWFGGGDGERVLRPASIEWTKPFIARLASVVRDVHARGVVHGDLHPGNVVVLRPGMTLSDARPLLIDFGHAHVCVGDGCTTATHLTRREATLSVHGTLLAKQTPRPRTWSPTRADDMQSLVLLAEWLVGELPNGVATSVADKRKLLSTARARWGIILEPPSQPHPKRWEATPRRFGTELVNAKKS